MFKYPTIEKMAIRAFQEVMDAEFVTFVEIEEPKWIDAFEPDVPREYRSKERKFGKVEVHCWKEPK